MQCPKRTNAGARGFTLIELLSVVSIVGVLASLSIVGLLQAQGKARRVKCLSNLRQLNSGIALFVADHGEYPLAINKQVPEGKYPAHSGGWPGSVLKELGLPTPTGAWTGIWDCPSASKPGEFPSDIGYFDYGYNANGFGTAEGGAVLGLGGHFVTVAPSMSPPVKADEVVNPSELLSVGDGFSGWNGAVQDGSVFIGRGPWVEERFVSSVRSRKRHDAQANMAFCDAHVETLSLESLFVETSDSALRRWNRDGQPHRERLLH